MHVYLPTMPAGVALTYIEATTSPGDLILDPFCQTPQVIREGFALGRRVLASNFNPVAIQAVKLALNLEGEPGRQAMSAALTHLADSQLTGARPLRVRLATHYATRCPTCQKQAQAEWFVWERDKNEPIEKRVRCIACKTSRGRVDEDDLAVLQRYPPHGQTYWLLLDRAVPPAARHEDERERASAVLAVYTPRTLAALADLFNHLDTLTESDRAALSPLLLETLAECSAIHPQDERGHSVRPRSLKLPSHFIERNVWYVLEAALERNTSPPPPVPNALRYADMLSALLTQREPAVHLVAHSSREIARQLAPGRIALVIGLPPEPDPTFWALSAVWSAWLWKERATEVTHTLLERRRADKEWMWRALTPIMSTLAGPMSQNGKLVLIHPAADDEWLGGLILAGAGAGLTLEHALVEPHEGLRLCWKRGELAPPARQLDAEALGMEVMEVAERAALEVIRARSEPTAWIQLAAGIYQALARTDLLKMVAYMPTEGSPPGLALLTHLVRGTFEGRETALQRVEGSQHLWWTNRLLVGTGLPLCDLVEMAVYDALQQAQELEETTVVHNVYRRFHGVLTPERTLVALCLESYAQQVRPGVCALREQDRAEARLEEIKTLREALCALGRRLEWEVTLYSDRVVWSERRAPAFTFLFSATAQLAPYLLTKRPPGGVPVLVVPGGRAGLIEYKLRRNTPFRDAVAGAGWQFLKFRHLRTLLADPLLSRASFQSALGRDPLIESLLF